MLKPFSDTGPLDCVYFRVVIAGNTSIWSATGILEKVDIVKEIRPGRSLLSNR